MSWIDNELFSKLTSNVVVSFTLSVIIHWLTLTTLFSDTTFLDDYLSCSKFESGDIVDRFLGFLITNESNVWLRLDLSI